MKTILLKILLFYSGFLLSQTSYEKGYFINTSGERTECLIKNLDWRYSPTNITYKLTDESNKQDTSLENIIEFGCYNSFKFIKTKVEIDHSSELLDNLSSSWEPSLKTETIFLEVLLEGKANLYSYQSHNFSRYFYSIGSNTIEQLIYKEYLDRKNNVNENNTFRNQLLENMNCHKL